MWNERADKRQAGQVGEGETDRRDRTKDRGQSTTARGEARQW
ncbi:MAG: hypothetical protein QHG98_09740 [Methanothrix sp.]|nr:hypothetical protein [Methanothrix sp.]HOK59288.1 hypothetical protein [Methanothrix sp.]